MSENWGHYLANIAEHTASIIFDEGIAGSIKSYPENTSYLIIAPLQEMKESRLPTDAEAVSLEKLLDDLEALFKSLGGYSVGRVTYNGERHHFFYINAGDEDLSARIYEIGREWGYDLRGGSREDPEKKAYFEHLYPDPESRQVMMDMRVIEHLLKHGDNIHAPRRVDHLSIFQSKKAAEAYAEWALQAGYELDPIRREGRLFKKEFSVESHNVTAVGVSDINPHSLGHFRKALEFGGVYDGWGCHAVPQSTE